MNKIFLIIALIVLGIGFGLYAYLGGFNSAEIRTTTSKTQFLIGKYYAGPVEGDQMGMLFRNAAELLEKKEVSGVLANIYYNSPEAQTDSIKAFIGIMIKDTTARIPLGYELKTLPGGKKVVQASIQAHYSLSPKKLYPALFEYFKKNKITNTQPYLEIFPTHRTALVQTEIAP